MASWLYIGDDERYYPSLSLTVHPGDTYDADENPDPPHFDPVTADGEDASQSTAPVADPDTTPEA